MKFYFFIFILFAMISIASAVLVDNPKVPLVRTAKPTSISTTTIINNGTGSSPFTEAGGVISQVNSGSNFQPGWTTMQGFLDLNTYSLQGFSSLETIDGVEMQNTIGGGLDFPLGITAPNICYSDGTNCTAGSGGSSYNATYELYAYNQSDALFNQYGIYWYNMSGGGTGSQTPWTSDIDADNYGLYNLLYMEANGSIAPPTNGAFSVGGTGSGQYDGTSNVDYDVYAYKIINGYKLFSEPLHITAGFTGATNVKVTITYTDSPDADGYVIIRAFSGLYPYADAPYVTGLFEDIGENSGWYEFYQDDISRNSIIEAYEVNATYLSGDGSALTGISTFNSTYDIWAYNQTEPFTTWYNSGSPTAIAWITTGGTSSDFVKGDGSLDSSAYITTAGETDPSYTTWYNSGSPSLTKLNVDDIYDVSNVLVFDVDSGLLYNQGNSYVAIDLEQRIMKDSTNQETLDWQSKELIGGWDIDTSNGISDTSSYKVCTATGTSYVCDDASCTCAGTGTCASADICTAWCTLQIDEGITTGCT